MNLKKLLAVAGVGLVLFFLITQPGQSADIVHGMLQALKHGAEAIIAFMKNLFR